MDPQKKYWTVLLFIDEHGEDLTSDEIDFVAGLIDGDREGTLTQPEMTKVRYLLQRRAGGWAAFHRHEDRVLVERRSES